MYWGDFERATFEEEEWPTKHFSLLRFAVSHRTYAKIVTMKQFRPTPIRLFVPPILALLSPEKCGWALKIEPVHEGGRR